MKEREAAKKMFKGERGAALAAELGQKSKTFTLGAPVVNGASKPAPSAQAKQDMEAIKVRWRTKLVGIHRLIRGLRIS